MAKVLGKDKKGRVRGMGSNMTKRQMIQLGIAVVKSKSKKDEQGEDVAFKNYINEAIQVELQVLILMVIDIYYLCSC